MTLTKELTLLRLVAALALVNFMVEPIQASAKKSSQQHSVANQFVEFNSELMKSWQPKIKSLCRNRKVSISNVSGMLQLIEAINHDELRCAERYRAAIYELIPILMRKKERLCNDITFEMIKHYHFRFIQPHIKSFGLPTGKVFKGQLHPEPRTYFLQYDDHDQILMAPISVRHFFLKFALQVSHQCKMDLIKNLVRDQERVLESDDLELMAPFTEALLGEQQAGAESPSGIDFDNVLYIPELDGLKRRVSGELYEPTGGDSSQPSLLRTTADEGSDLYRMIVACRSRFEPIYNQLIVPIVRLSKLGYDYQGPKGWTESERSFLDSNLVRDWLVIVHVCEIFKYTRLVRVKPKLKTLGEFLTSKDDDDDDEGKPFALARGDSIDSSQEEELLDDRDLEPVEYSPSERYLMEDELLVVKERELDQELARKFGKQKEGAVEAFLRRLANRPKRVLAVVDPMQFAHYRRNIGWYTGIVKFISSTLALISIGFTLHGLAHGR